MGETMPPTLMAFERNLKDLSNHVTMLRLGALFLCLLSLGIQPANAQPAGARARVQFSILFQDGVMAGWSFQGQANLSFEELVDHLIFPQDKDADEANDRLELFLWKEIKEIDRSCKLTWAQKQKLWLVGRGDIKRFFDEFDLFVESPFVQEEFQD